MQGCAPCALTRTGMGNKVGQESWVQSPAPFTRTTMPYGTYRVPALCSLARVSSSSLVSLLYGIRKECRTARHAMTV